MNKALELYNKLYKEYGPQGWWPITNYEGCNVAKVGATKGYHPSDYSFPRNPNETFEVCLGSILTQNTTFTSVEKSLRNLNELNALTPEEIKGLTEETFKTAIRPSGYHNQKARYINNFIDFFEELDGTVPEREQLLAQIGIGPETADSILLYAYNEPELKVDAYTKRLLVALDLIPEKAKYHDVKTFLEEGVKSQIKDKKELVIIFQELHALIVNHCKQFYSKKPYGKGCSLTDR